MATIQAPTNTLAPPGAPGPTSFPVDPYGYTMYPHGATPKGAAIWPHAFLGELENAPSFLANMGMFQQGQQTINDILARHGQMDPAVLARANAAIAASTANARRALAAKAGASGEDPSSMQYQMREQGIEQQGQRALQDARFNQNQAAAQREREDLNLVIPYMQALMGYTQPTGKNTQVMAAPVGQAPKTDWAGIGAQLAGSFLTKAMPQNGYGWFGSEPKT